MIKMTAKEMFETLNYKEFSNNGFEIIYSIENLISIYFSKNSKTYECRDNRTNAPIRVSVQEHKAITQQMKELGWFE